jgi:hypothetical protein
VLGIPECTINLGNLGSVPNRAWWWLKGVETGSPEVVFYILCNKLLRFDWYFYTLYILTFHYHQFLSTLLTFKNWVHWTGMRPYGWQIGFPHISQIMSLNKIDCICVLWNETLFQSLNVFYASKSSSDFIKSKVPTYIKCLETKHFPENFISKIT